VAIASSQAMVKQLKVKLDKAWSEYMKYNKAVDFYEKTANIQAATIIKTANLNYKNGEINYIEWGMLINQANAIKSQYLESLRLLNVAVAEIHYLLNN
jgi:cobalt-zinc-cadmium resistance protein CzcA